MKVIYSKSNKNDSGGVGAPRSPDHQEDLMDEQRIAQVVEELDRIKAARPTLASRVERAENIIVTQFSVSNGSRPVRVRLLADGTHEYRVRSGSKLQREYVIDPRSWSCNCPDHEKRSAACKHVIACFTLAHMDHVR